MSGKSPKVYVGIVTYNSAALMRACIDAVMRQTYAPITVVVLDNNSKDLVEKVIKQYNKKVIFIQSTRNLGFGGGHNKIISSIPLRASDYYLALNPDALLDSHCVKILVGEATKRGADWATGKLYRDMGSLVLYSVGHAMCRDGYTFNIGYGHKDKGQYDQTREVFGAPGAAALYKGSMVRAISESGCFFDPSLFMYHEDVDVDWRARLKGLRCWFIPGAKVLHNGGSFPSYLEAEVLVNRFVSIIKNAFLIDLVFYNIPNILIHIMFRLIVTPKIGVQIIVQLSRKLWPALLHRTRPVVTRDEIFDWFAHTPNEQAGVPITITQRLSMFVRRGF